MIPRSTKYAVICLGVYGAVWAEDFRKDSKITQLAGDVLNQPVQGTVHSAAVKEVLTPGDLLKTGSNSRAELVSSDQTVIRVGANSIFSFSDQSRQMMLEQGSVLFHTPHGQGGGIIKTAAITASVTGSTVAVTTTSTGGAKVVPLESPCSVVAADGRQIARLNPGQMLAMIPGNRPMVFAIDLGAFTKSSGLIKSFATPLSSSVQSKIDQNVNKQAANIQQRTNIVLIDNFATQQNNGPGGPGQNQSPQPPPEIHQQAGPPLDDFTGINGFVFDTTFVANITSDLTITPDGQGHNYDALVRLVNNQSDLTRSPLEFINQAVGGPLVSSYFSGIALPDGTLATLGITPAYPSNFNLPGSAMELFAGIVTLQGAPAGDPNSADLGKYRSAGLLGVSALKSLSFVPTDLSGQQFNFIHAPTYFAIGSAGSFTIDGGQLHGTDANGNPNRIEVNALDAMNFSLGSVGLLTLNRVDLTLSTGNLFIGSLEAMSISNVNLNTAGAISLYAGSGADLNLARVTFRNSPNVTVKSLGNLSVKDILQVNGPGALIPTLTMTAAGQLNFTPSQFLFTNSGTINLTANTLYVANLNFSTNQTVYLKSLSGVANFGGNVIRGDINLNNVSVNNVTVSNTTANSNLHFGAR